jgi:tetratricopeptide (TPR) repeat protein
LVIPAPTSYNRAPIMDSAPPPVLQPPPFLDVPHLLDASQPRARTGWFWYAAGFFLLLVMISTYLSSASPLMAGVMQLFSALVMLGLLIGMGMLTFAMAKAQQAEAQQLAAVEELMQLRRWGEAAVVLDGLLGAPMRAPQHRVQGLIYLATVLARYHRFADAIVVQEHLLEHVNLDPGTEHGLKLARVMSMLREDHLVDAHRAMSELRRGDAGRESAGLALLDIYRDVKTGHPDEAIEIFEERLPALRDQMGHRVGDAYYLAAKAYDLLGRDPEAARAYERATLLAPLSELQRRYPEAASLSDKYSPALAPAA